MEYEYNPDQTLFAAVHPWKQWIVDISSGPLYMGGRGCLRIAHERQPAARFGFLSLMLAIPLMLNCLSSGVSSLTSILAPHRDVPMTL